MPYKSSQILAYVDDLNMVGRKKCTIAETEKELENAADSGRLQVNTSKTKTMIQIRKSPARNDGKFTLLSDKVYFSSITSDDKSRHTQEKQR